MKRRDFLKSVSGLAAGALLARSQPAGPANLTYSGIGITDLHLLAGVAAEHGAAEATPQFGL